MKTKEDFIRRWKHHLAGLALYGIAFEAREGPIARAARALDIPAEVERLLAQMYADLAPTEPEPRAFQRTNGVPRAI